MANTYPEKNISSTTQELSPISSPNPPLHTQDSGFFPWLEDEEYKGLTLTSKILKRFPILGAIGLVGSALTVVLSWITLFSFDHRKVIEAEHIPKPASWLSIIFSLNSCMVQMAVSQGISVTWWYRASRQQVTVADLHNIWSTGSSVVSAITSWRAFNFIALATVFVATLPINGVLLQNSITSQGNQKNTTVAMINFPIADTLPADFSATLNQDGTVETYTPAFQSSIPYLVNNLDGVYESDNTNNTCQGECQATLSVIGFEANCIPSSVPFDLPLDNDTNVTARDVDIFSVSFGWNASAPTNISMNTLYKATNSCVGAFIVNKCTLALGKASYPVDVQYDAYGDSYYWSLNSQQFTLSQPSNTYVPSNFSLYPPAGPETKVTAFGGVVEALSSYYDGHIYLHPTENGTTLQIVGEFAQQLQLSNMGYYADGTPIVLPDKCNISFPSFGWDSSYTDPTSYLLDSVRTTLFYTSVFAADQSGTTFQTSYNVTEFKYQNEYVVLWRYWVASVAVTFCVILFILPTFYGFWTLPRKTTLSPVETARAFQAPVMREAPADADTNTLLKEVGGKNLHSTLGNAAGSGSGLQGPIV